MIPVAGYCRVSTDKEDQVNSFESQKRYFRGYIEEHPDWTLYKIYADEGITGTSTKKRIQFNQMIRDAGEGRFRLILTKEVSRFSRNILDTIRYTRKLKDLGVGVIFVTDRINTLEPEAEMLLSFLASMAQEESRRTSSRVVWGQTRQMERGVVFGHSLLGYDVKDGILSVNPEGAETVRLIFHKYAVEQAGTCEIARYLTAHGYRTGGGSMQWKSNTIVKILHNEKYAGDLIQKKTYTPDYLTHAKKANRGQVPLVAIENHHEPIVSREIWDLTQQRLRRNNKHGNGNEEHSNRYLFSGKIRCAQCGSRYIGRIRYRKDGTKIRRWSCGRAARAGTEGCDVGKLLRDDDALQMLKTAIRSLPADKDSIIRHVTALAVESIRDGIAGTERDPSRIRSELDRLHRKKAAVMDSYFSGDISKEDMQFMNCRYDNRLKTLSVRLQEAELQQRQQDTGSLEETLRSEISGILNGETESEVFYKTLLAHITVFKDRHMELVLNGLPQPFRFTG